MCTSKAEKLRRPDGQEGIYMKRVGGRVRGRKGKNCSGREVTHLGHGDVMATRL